MDTVETDLEVFFSLLRTLIIFKLEKFYKIRMFQSQKLLKQKCLEKKYIYILWWFIFSQRRHFWREPVYSYERREIQFQRTSRDLLWSAQDTPGRPPGRARHVSRVSRTLFEQSGNHVRSQRCEYRKIIMFLQ